MNNDVGFQSFLRFYPGRHAAAPGVLRLDVSTLLEILQVDDDVLDELRGWVEFQPFLRFYDEEEERQAPHFLGRFQPFLRFYLRLDDLEAWLVQVGFNPS